MARCQITSEKSSKNHISLFDGKPARGLPTPSPPPLCKPLPHIFHVLDGKCEPQVRDLLARITRGRGGGRTGWFAKLCHSITDHRINCKPKAKIASTILLLCYLNKICLTLSGGSWQASANLYIGGSFFFMIIYYQSQSRIHKIHNNHGCTTIMNWFRRTCKESKITLYYWLHTMIIMQSTGLLNIHNLISSLLYFSFKTC